MVFSTKYEPMHPLVERWETWTRLKQKFFGYEIDVPSGAAARILGGRIVFAEERKGQRVAVIEMERNREIFNAAIPGRKNTVASTALRPASSGTNGF